jgi:hypothetical protein
MRPIVRSKYIAVRVNANQGQGSAIEFPLDQTLQGAMITGIEVVNASVLAIAPDGQAVAPGTEVAKATLTLVDMDSKEKHKNYPLGLLDPTLNGGIWKEFVPFPANYQASTVDLEAAPAGAPYVFLFQVHFIPKDGK